MNSTLGFLRVEPVRLLLAPMGGQATVRWTQAHAARVRVTIETPEGILGWGECVASPAPRYSEEFNEAAWLVIRDHLGPAAMRVKRAGGMPVIGMESPRGVPHLTWR